MKVWIKAAALFWAIVFAAVSYDAEAQWMNWTTKPGGLTAGGTFSGAILGPDGTACSAPTYSFASTTTTGLTIDGLGVTVCYAGVKAITGSSGPVYVKGPLSIGNGTLNTAASVLTSDAAEALALRNGVSAQIFRAYNTFTDASNYERVEFGANPGGFGANTFGVAVNQAGTGTARDLYIGTVGNTSIRFKANNTDIFRFSSAGNFIANTDNALDIGAAGANRPRTGYFGTSLVTAVLRSTQASVPTCTSNCGTSPSVAGGDTAGIVTMGASGVPASGWVVTFNGTWAAAPSCVVQSALTTMVVGKQPIAVQTTTTTMTVTTNGTAPATSDKYAYHCIGVS